MVSFEEVSSYLRFRDKLSVLGNEIWEQHTRGQSCKDYTGNALIQATEKSASIDCVCAMIQEQLLVIWTLDSSLECVERVDEHVNSESCKCSGDPYVSIGVTGHLEGDHRYLNDTELQA